MPKILFVNPNFEDYQSDGLFHGLRTLLGADAVDFPKSEPMYETYPSARRARLYGRGFTLYGLLEDIDVDRNRSLDRATAGEFDLVVFGDIWRNFGLYTQWIPLLAGKVPVAVVDGSDRIEPYPYSGVWWRVRHWWFLPRAHNRTTYFKRELTPWTYWFRSYLTMPPPLSPRLLLRGMRTTAFSIPEEKVVPEPPEKEKPFPVHVVDPEVAERVGGQTSYAFEGEHEYYGDLRRSRYGITVKRAGWDCLRHYEIAASGCVPCFRALDTKPAMCAPHGLDEDNCVAYSDWADLDRKLDAVSDARYRMLQQGALAWARRNTTRARALEFLRDVGLEASLARPLEHAGAAR